MTEQELYVDPGHLLPAEDFAWVLKRAKEVREEIAAAAGGGAAGPGGIVVDMTAAGIRSGKYFPVSGMPTQLGVLHSAECPLRAGFAISLTEWFQATKYPQAPIASWQRFVDPVHRVRALPDELGAWHASEANPLSIGWEQAGYARFSRAEWLTPDGKAQLELLAFDMAEVAVRDGLPARWLTDWEVRQVLDHGNRAIKGFCLHRQIDPETRTDPGDNYPYELLMERISFYMSNGSGEEDDMALTEEQARNLAYLASPQFKADIFTGEDPKEVAARQAFHQEALRTEVPWYGFDGNQPADGRRTTSAATDIGFADARQAGTNGLIHGLQAQVKALAELAAAGNAGVTKEEILDRLELSVKDHLAQYSPAFVKNQEVGK